MKILYPILFCVSSAIAQSWQSCSVWGEPIPVNGSSVTVPDSYHNKVARVAFLTTTNASCDLRGGTISVVAQIATTGTPQFWWGSDCGGGLRYPNMRLYFTTTTGNYNLNYANAHEFEYWWAHEPAVACVQGGTVTLTASLDPALWSDSQGHYDAAGFLSAASRVGQVGLSFGGGCFFDVGIGIFNQNDPGSTAVITVQDLKLLRPTIHISADGALSVSNVWGEYVIQYSDDLQTWHDMPCDTAATTRFYRVKLDAAPGAG